MHPARAEGLPTRARWNAGGTRGQLMHMNVKPTAARPLTTLLRPVVFAAALLCAPGLAGADQLTLNFERFPGADGLLGTADDVFPGPGLITLGDQFAALGLTFTQGTLGQSSFFDGDPSNHFITSTPPIAFFSTPVFGVAIESYSFWTATLAAFDASNNLLASVTIPNGTAGNQPVRGTLGIQSGVPIHHFSVFPQDPDQILNLDNLVLTTSDPVPEPSTLILTVVGGVLAAARRRKVPADG